MAEQTSKRECSFQPQCMVPWWMVIACAGTPWSLASISIWWWWSGGGGGEKDSSLSLWLCLDPGRRNGESPHQPLRYTGLYPDPDRGIDLAENQWFSKPRSASAPFNLDVQCHGDSLRRYALVTGFYLHLVMVVWGREGVRRTLHCQSCNNSLKIFLKEFLLKKCPKPCAIWLDVKY